MSAFDQLLHVTTSLVLVEGEVSYLPKVVSRLVDPWLRMTGSQVLNRRYRASSLLANAGHIQSPSSLFHHCPRCPCSRSFYDSFAANIHTLISIHPYFSQNNTKPLSTIHTLISTHPCSSHNNTKSRSDSSPFNLQPWRLQETYTISLPRF